MRIAVLMGGVSSEREISILSSYEVVKALRTLGHEVSVIELTQGLLTASAEQDWFNLKADQIPLIERAKSELALAPILESIVGLEKVFIGLHGGRGENGSVQKELSLLQIPFTGSGSHACALALDKNLTKKHYQKHQLPTPDWCLYNPENELHLQYPLIIKPNQEGSSVGLSLVHDQFELDQALGLALQYDTEVMIEKYIDGVEYTVGILDDEALTPGGIYPKSSKLFDYKAKYQSDATDEVFPPNDLSDEEIKHLKFLGLEAHRSLGLSGYSRTDFIKSNTGQFYLIETNTLPGLTQQSLLPKSALASGIDFLSLIEAIIK